MIVSKYTNSKWQYLPLFVSNLIGQTVYIQSQRSEKIMHLVYETTLMALVDSKGLTKPMKSKELTEAIELTNAMKMTVLIKWIASFGGLKY